MDFELTYIKKEKDIMITINETEQYKEITCAEGEYITDYVDTMDVKEFYGCGVVYTPLGTNTDKYHVISSDEYERLESLKKAAEEEERKREEEERQIEETQEQE